jgi:hypothetical protein
MRREGWIVYNRSVIQLPPLWGMQPSWWDVKLKRVKANHTGTGPSWPRGRSMGRSPAVMLESTVWNESSWEVIGPKRITRKPHHIVTSACQSNNNLTSSVAVVKCVFLFSGTNTIGGPFVNKILRKLSGKKVKWSRYTLWRRLGGEEV